MGTGFASGWKVSNPVEFLNLTNEEAAIIELKNALVKKDKNQTNKVKSIRNSQDESQTSSPVVKECLDNDSIIGQGEFLSKSPNKFLIEYFSL